jgi:hypothetical protein
VYGGDFVPRAARLGIDTLLTPFRAPKANAIAERVVRTLRNECLDHVLILNERHLRTVLAEYVAYYNVERPHRSLLIPVQSAKPAAGTNSVLNGVYGFLQGSVALEPPLPDSRSPVITGAVRSRPVLGGLHHVSSRAA